jgi:hypothetical protein
MNLAIGNRIDQLRCSYKYGDSSLVAVSFKTGLELDLTG